MFTAKRRTWTDTLVQHKKRNSDMRFGTWNVRGLYRAGLFTAAVRELGGLKLYLVGVQRVDKKREGTVRAGEYNLIMERK